MYMREIMQGNNILRYTRCSASPNRRFSAAWTGAQLAANDGRMWLSAPLRLDDETHQGNMSQQLSLAVDIIVLLCWSIFRFFNSSFHPTCFIPSTSNLCSTLKVVDHRNDMDGQLSQNEQLGLIAHNKGRFSLQRFNYNLDGSKILTFSQNAKLLPLMVLSLLCGTQISISVRLNLLKFSANQIKWIMIWDQFQYRGPTVQEPK